MACSSPSKVAWIADTSGAEKNTTVSSTYMRKKDNYFYRVSMGLTVSRKTAKNLAVRRIN